MGSHVWQFLAGIALFLYALDLLEGIAKSGGSAFQKRVQKATNTKLKSVLTGIGLVNIIQSSHAVSLILLALVGGGLISLVNAIGVIIGMNIGSVFMEAFVGLFGLGFDLDTYVLPIIAIGGLGAFFSKKYRNIFLIILSLGLVFFGLEMMKDGVAVMKESIDLSQYTHLGRGWYILIGFIGTNMIQSSSAMTIITMTALYEDIIPFPMAVALLMGAYIGSTTTAFIVSLNGSALKKQVAVSHVLFNIITCAIFCLGFGLVMSLIQNTRGFGSNEPRFGSFVKSSVNGLIVFFVLFKSVGGLLHLPFLSQFTRLVQWIVPDDKTNVLGIENIDPKLDAFTSYTILKLDIKKFVEKTAQLVKERTNHPEKYNEDLYLQQKSNYEKIFHFLIVFPFNKLGLQKGEEIYTINALQESMQGIDTIASAYISLKKISISKDSKTQSYRNQIVVFCNEIYDLIDKNEFKAAEKQLQTLRNWDEQEMANLIKQGREVSSELPELFQIHDKIHGAVFCILESKLFLSKLV